MNVRHAIVENAIQRPARFLQVSFNQDDSCFSAATEDGFLIYNTDPLSCKLRRKFGDSSGSRGSGSGAGIGLTRMLYRTNYTALVGGGKRPKYPLNKLVIWDDLQQRESVVLKFMSPLKQVFLSRVHIVVVLDCSVEVFQFQPNPKRICPSLDISPQGPVDFVVGSQIHKKHPQELPDSSVANNNPSPQGINGMLAFPSARSTGQVHIADLSRLKHNDQNPDGTQLLPTSIIKAHKTPVRFLRLNHQGTMVATCSIQGTLIRIFSTHNGSLIKEFRRGLDRADIYDMAFSPKGTRLAVVSDKQTLHIFQISTKEFHGSSNVNDEPGKNKMHALKNVVPSSWKPKYLDSVWSMCSVQLKNPMVKRNGIDPQFQQDRCKIGWCRDGGDNNNNDFDEEDSIVLVWQNTGIWEKYVILEKEQQSKQQEHIFSAHETLRGDGNKSNKTQWELVRESWREL